MERVLEEMLGNVIIGDVAFNDHSLYIDRRINSDPFCKLADSSTKVANTESSVEALNCSKRLTTSKCPRSLAAVMAYPYFPPGAFTCAPLTRSDRTTATLPAYAAIYRAVHPPSPLALMLAPALSKASKIVILPIQAAACKVFPYGPSAAFASLHFSAIL